MTDFTILIWPHPKLKMVSRVVDQPPNPAFVQSMFDAMRKAGGVGLSAIQVGIPERVVVSEIAGERRVWVNPTWVPISESEVSSVPIKPTPLLEGCLSTPGQFEVVWRYPEIEVVYQDEQLERKSERLRGLTAQMIQHETEHLEGKMFTDHLKSADRSRIMGAMMKLKRAGK